jgi:hypothetical protein
MSAPTRRMAAGWARSAAAPSAIPPKTLACPPVPVRVTSNARRSLIATVNAAATPKVTALTANAVAGEPISSSTPPSAGPAITPVAVTADRAAFAPGRSPLRTSFGVTAETHGR